MRVHGQHKGFLIGTTACTHGPTSCIPRSRHTLQRGPSSRLSAEFGQSHLRLRSNSVLQLSTVCSGTRDNQTGNGISSGRRRQRVSRGTTGMAAVRSFSVRLRWA